MKCNLCNEEYEFSLGHRCPVMQEESKPRMTQPDLVSKLREAVETIRSLASHIPHSRAELPGNPSTWCDRCKFDAALVVLADPSASPSTPIVPGTAGEWWKAYSLCSCGHGILDHDNGPVMAFCGQCRCTRFDGTMSGPKEPSDA